MSVQLRVFLGIIIIAYFGLIFRFLHRKILILKYALLWLFMGLILAVLVVFPNILKIIASFLGIQMGVNALFLLGIGFIIILVMSLTAIVSHQTERIRTLAQDNAMLEKRIRDLEKKI